MQINEDTWLKKSQSLGYNIYTTEGNLGFALWLFQKEGFRPWKATTSQNQTNLQVSHPNPSYINGFTLIAPVGAYSEPPFSVKGRPFKAVPQGEVIVRNERGQEFYVGPNNLPDIGYTETLQYKSLGDEPVKVIITFR
jgi:hypothetical protein